MIRENQHLLNKVNALSDIVILFISVTISYFIRFSFFNVKTDYIELNKYLQFMIVIIPINAIIYYFFNLYDSFRTKSFSKEISSIIKANTIVISIILSTLFAVKLVDLSRLVIVIFYFVNTILIIIKRGLLRKILSNLRKRIEFKT